MSDVQRNSKLAGRLTRAARTARKADTALLCSTYSPQHAPSAHLLACFFGLSIILTSSSRARGDVCSGSNLKTYPSEVDIAATAAEAEDEEGRDKSREYERGKLWQISEYDI
ncbi:uncharacterized protein F5147DRAFT_659040 [Suillus discolor]|uniref:Uncharacterized protein n=1 Tax=Suillus discolor TaxID=1912936 RepID=A0A9P7JLU3_9AGAM|nr:uncharacterized protein F5147DRAFT_659040 [Suillus discolor]KAG2087127.1 hypothetical protein F5147DRAFT_659040 [Suillus discolor]